MNYSHFLLVKRFQLVKYFSNVITNLNSRGIFIIDLFGGSHIFEDHKYDKSCSDVYQFTGSNINILNNISKCALNFKEKKNKYRNLFNYNFRVYSIIELIEALEEVGFNYFKLYLKEISDDDDFEEYEEVNLDGILYELG